MTSDELQRSVETAPKVILGPLIEKVLRTNDDLQYGLSDVRGVTNNKEIASTKANVAGRALETFLVVNPEEFVFNRRVHGTGARRLGLGFNTTGRPFIFTNDYVAFRVSSEKLLPYFLFLYILREDFNRYVVTNSWGSATEFFNWDDMCRVKIPLPPIEVQKAYVDAYKGLTTLIEQSEALLNTLEKAAQACVVECREKWPFASLKDLISETNDRNTDKSIIDVKGISTIKKFREPSSRVDKSNLGNYKIVRKGEFAYVPTTDTWRCLAVCLSDYEAPIVVSPIYITFKVADPSRLLPEYLQLHFLRNETDRYARFNSWGSARENFNWDDMCRVKIPLPPLEVQKAIVALYRCAEEARKIADEARHQLSVVCPAMIQRASRVRAGEKSATDSVL